MSDFAKMLPPAYAWLDEINPLPRMVAEGLRLFGTAEAAGAADNPAIIGWAAEVGEAVACAYRADAVPWCGLFMAVVAARAGKSVPAQPLWALNWRSFGVAADVPALGDVLVFRRPGGGGHVGLYVGEDERAYHVLGGNQGNRVCISRIAKGRLAAARRPAYRVAPACVVPVWLAALGALSTNER